MQKGVDTISKHITIVMYHYIRDVKNSRYPEIKSLSVSDFKEQLLYIKKHYNVITMDELKYALDSGAAGDLHPNPLLLTFDDGYIDHFTNVFPILDELGLQGSFFPPAESALERCMLDVNKIHFILAAVDDKSSIITEIFDYLDKLRTETKPMNLEIKDNSYYESLAEADYLDTKEVVFIKKMLQRELPELVRTELINYLFKKFVTVDEKSFANELYMNIDQISCMKRHGMYIGSHGFRHCRLDILYHDELSKEIEHSIDFLNRIGCKKDNWVMCYPYGSYNDMLISLLEKNGCKAGFTTERDMALIGEDNPLTLPRLDTNDLPKSRNADLGLWTMKSHSFKK